MSVDATSGTACLPGEPLLLNVQTSEGWTMQVQPLG